MRPVGALSKVLELRSHSMNVSLGGYPEGDRNASVGGIKLILRKDIRDL